MKTWEVWDQIDAVCNVCLSLGIPWLKFTALNDFFGLLSQ